MNDFVSLIGALAWPSASLAIAVLFRRELRMALGRLGQVKYGAMELTFREDLRQAEALARLVPQSSPAAGPGASAPGKVQFEAEAADASELQGTMVGHETSPETTVIVAGAKPEVRAGRDRDSFLHACLESPRLGIIGAWDELGRLMIRAAVHLGDRRARTPLGTEAALKFLVDRGWLGAVEGKIVDRLRRIADEVHHREGPPITLDEAQRYVELAFPVIERIAHLM